MKFTSMEIRDIINFFQEESCKQIDIGKYCNYFCHRLTTMDLLDEEELKDIGFLFEIFDDNVINKDGKGYKKLLNYMKQLITTSKENTIILKILELEKIKGMLNDIDDGEIVINTLRKFITELSKYKISYHDINIKLNWLFENSNLLLKKEYLNIVSSLVEYIKKDNNVSARIGSLEKYRNFCERLMGLSNKISRNINKEQDKRIKDNNHKSKFLSDDIFYNDSFSMEILNSIQIIDLPHEEDDSERILSIDNPLSPDLDGAFSIKKESDYYIFKVYITNVPSFLKENPSVAKEAYRRGTSLYIRNGIERMDTHIDMLPPYLSCDKLSLLQDCYRNAIVFEYVITDEGVVENKSITIKCIKVLENLSPAKVLNLLKNKSSLDLIQKDLKLYGEVVSKVAKKSNKKFLKKLSGCNVEDLVAFPSIITNYYIGDSSQFVIYRENGEYSKECEMNYTHSVTPLRRFVSDINLAFFLNQNGVESFDEKKLNYVESNIDEILNHLNYRASLANYVNEHSYQVKKFIKKAKLK